MNYKYCMTRKCNECKKQIECERGEGDSKRTEFKTNNKQQNGERIAREIGRKKKRKSSKGKNI